MTRIANDSILYTILVQVHVGYCECIQFTKYTKFLISHTYYYRTEFFVFQTREHIYYYNVLTIQVPMEYYDLR